MRARKWLGYLLVAGVMGLAVLVVANLALGDKRIDQRVEHLYPVASPQFERAMNVLLGPQILPGNRARAGERARDLPRDAEGHP